MEILQEKKRLDFGLTFRQAMEMGVKNAPSLLGCALLYLLTIWIPYINIGTTIAMANLPLEMSRGNVVNPTFIFQAKWRRYMGDFLLTGALMMLGVYGAMLFLVIPAFVLSMSWSLAILLLFDKKLTPLQALAASNKVTYGSKWTMFFVNLVFVICAYVLLAIIVVPAAKASAFLAVILALLLGILFSAVGVAIKASIYGQLKGNLDCEE